MINQQNVDEIRLVDNETQQNPPSPKNNAVNYTLNESISFLPLLLVIVLFILIILLSAYQSVLPQLNKTLLILQIVTAITGIIVGSFAFYRIQQKLLSPLSGLNAWINRVSKGDLSARVDVPVGGELENIIRKINKLGESLKTQCQNMDNQVRIQTERISQKTRSLEILYDAAAGIGHLHDLDELLIRFLHTLKDLVHARAAVVRLMTDEGLMRLIACIGLDENYQDEERLIPSSQCLFRTVCIYKPICNSVATILQLKTLLPMPKY